jgi:hypothetical protein
MRLELALVFSNRKRACNAWRNEALCVIKLTLTKQLVSFAYYPEIETTKE